MQFEKLATMVNDDAAIRRRQRLQPVGGQGDKIFPPTYPAEGRSNIPRHAYERRFIGNAEVSCVLVDSVQSQANRLEEALRDAIADGIEIPHLVVDFTSSGLAGVSKLTTLDTPHRVYDAIMRDSSLKGEPFMQSEIGRELAIARPANAAALLEYSPSALVFGAWHSTSEGGGLGAKFARCLTSEVIAVNVPVDHSTDRNGTPLTTTAAQRTGSRMDPLGIIRKVEVFKGEDGWSTTQKGAGKKAKQVRPSEINHGNIAPSVMPLGITCEYAEQMFVLSFAALRRLKFGSEQQTRAGRAYLAALGLLALAEQDVRGYALRSRCDLVCDGRAPLEIVHADGSTNTMNFDRKTARALYMSALEGARKAGFKLPGEPLVLEPQPKLVEIVRRSQELALAGAGSEEDDNGDSA